MSRWRHDPVPHGGTGSAVAAGSPVLERAIGPLRYVPVTPFRIVASPDDGVAGKLYAPGGRSGPVWEDTAGNPQIPTTVAAVTYTVTITQTVGAGYLAVMPANAPSSGISTINWTTSGVDRANNGTVGVGPRGIDGLVGCISIECTAPFSATHYILDITGYYI